MSDREQVDITDPRELGERIAPKKFTPAGLPECEDRGRPGCDGVAYGLTYEAWFNSSKNRIERVNPRYLCQPCCRARDNDTRGKTRVGMVARRLPGSQRESDGPR
jgi:hypothetical protein